MTETAAYVASAVEDMIARVEAAEVPAWNLCMEAKALGVEVVKPGTSSHLWELTVFGIHARGETADELCRHWITVARNSLPALKARPATPEEQRLVDLMKDRAYALFVIARPHLFTTAEIRSACETITMSKSDPVEFTRADALLRQIRAETEGGRANA